MHQINNVSLSLEIDQFSPYSDLIYSDKSYQARINGFILSARKCLQFLIRTFSAFHSDDTRADRPALMQCPPLLYCISLYEPYCCYQLNTHTIMELQATFENVRNQFLELSMNSRDIWCISSRSANWGRG